MKKVNVLFSIIIGFAIVFAVLPWLVPFGDIAAFPDSISLTEKEVHAFAKEQSFGKFVSADYNKENSTLELKLFNLIPVKTIETAIAPPTKVYLGGVTVGVDIDNDGVIVLGSNPVQTKEGEVRVLEKELLAGDIIKEVNGQRVTTTKSLSELINQSEEMNKNGDATQSEKAKQKQVVVKAMRKNKEIEVKLKPAYDIISKKYKLGLWVRDDASGIGTLTYVREDNLRFGALGHPISDSVTGSAVDARAGRLYSCEVVGIVKGGRGSPGELRGLMQRGRAQQGVVTKNNKYGVFGDIKSNSVLVSQARLVEVGGRSSVKPGKAKIHSCIDGNTIEEFDIEIIKTNYQTHSNEKSLVFKVTDKDLLRRTGGIVQGMSGSPIVQGGKLVGAVTHVFVNDSTKGFGIYIDWMINE